MSKSKDIVKFENLSEKLFFSESDADALFRYSSGGFDQLVPWKEKLTALRNEYVRRENLPGCLALMATPFDDIFWGMGGCALVAGAIAAGGVATWVFAILAAILLIKALAGLLIGILIFGVVMVIFKILKRFRFLKFMLKPNSPRNGLIILADICEKLEKPYIESIEITGIEKISDMRYKLKTSEKSLELDGDTYREYYESGTPRKIFKVINGFEIIDQENNRLEIPDVIAMLREIDKISARILG